MKFEPAQKILKNGKAVVLREATKKDATQLLNILKQHIAAGEYLITTSDEFTSAKQQQKNWIESIQDSRNGILLVAVYNNEIIGNIDIKGEPRKKIRHNGMLGIGVLKEWQTSGVGTALMESAIQWAKASLTLENIWLHVFSTNNVAIHLYKKFGFVEVAIQKEYIKEIDGIYRDNILMKLNVKV
jgi:RimJ/RimL family protein N-acetyltransferase